MAELLPSERLQPCLIDRLVDDEPDKQKEPRERRVFSMRQLRAAVLRDLSWLLNASSKTNTGELADFPEASMSVINYGMPDYTGRTVSVLTPGELEQAIRKAIEFFEPRILKGSLRVTTAPRREQPGFNTVAIEVNGDMWAQSVPEHLLLRTEVDLETGQCRLREANRG